MAAAAEASGVELLEANSDNKLEKETQLIDTYIARGVQAIALTPLSADGSIPAIRPSAIVTATFSDQPFGNMAWPAKMRIMTSFYV